MIISRQNIEKILPEFKNISDVDFVDACNSVGMEVEQIFNCTSPTGLVIGEIINVQPHPNSEKLHICTVNTGAKEPQIIVCGAQNVKNGWKCVVALQETKLHDGKVILNREVRGVMSQGMICGYCEITTSNQFLSKEDEEGVILLKDAKVGETNIGPYLGLDDVLYEITLPSDRNDLNGLFFFCLEISKYFGFKFSIKEDIQINGTETKKFIENTNLCSFFSTTEVTNVKVESSDWKIKKELMAAGIKPVNSIVDGLNLITAKTNMPSAVYDADLLPSKDLRVEKAGSQITIIGVDGKKYIVEESDLVVKSKDEVISIAGVIGVDKYKITENTKNILIELGNFDYFYVRTTATRLNCFTDAAKRFSKEMSTWINKKALSLLQETYPSSESIFYIEEHKNTEIKIEESLLKEFLDLDISYEQCLEVLKKSGFVITDNMVSIPNYRCDIKNQQDLFEEILKIVDFNKLPSKPIVADFIISELAHEHNVISKIKRIMNSNYFQEIKSYNLTSEKEVNDFNIFKITPAYKICNANNESRSILRTNLIDSLLKTYEFNASYKNELQPIFEIQKIYSSSVLENISAITEEKKIIDNLNGSQIIFNIPILKSLVNEIASENNVSLDFFPISNNEYLYEDESFAIHCKGQLVGYIGLIKARNLKKYSLSNRKIYCLTINLNIILNNQRQKALHVEQFSNLIPITRDISFPVKNEQSIKEVVSELKNIKNIKEFKFIDRFTNKNKETNYTIRIWFNNEEKATSEAIDSQVAQIINKIFIHTSV